jgi:hypothetical protein
MDLNHFIHERLMRGAQHARDALGAASLRARSTLNAIAAYRRAYSISRDFRRLSS